MLIISQLQITVIQPQYLDDCQYDKIKTKRYFLKPSVTVYDIYIKFFPFPLSQPRPTPPPRLPNSIIQTIQSLTLYSGFWEKFSKVFCSGNLYTQYRDTRDSKLKQSYSESLSSLCCCSCYVPSMETDRNSLEDSFRQRFIYTINYKLIYSMITLQ